MLFLPLFSLKLNLTHGGGGEGRGEKCLMVYFSYLLLVSWDVVSKLFEDL